MKAEFLAPPEVRPLGEWNRWLVSMPSRLIYTPWPFPVSGTEQGLTLNVRVGLDMPTKKGARRRPSKPAEQA